MNFSITLTGKNGGWAKCGEDKAVFFHCLSRRWETASIRQRYETRRPVFPRFFVREGEEKERKKGGRGSLSRQTRGNLYRDNSKGEARLLRETREHYFVVLERETRDVEKSLSLGNFARQRVFSFFFFSPLLSRVKSRFDFYKNETAMFFTVKFFFFFFVFLDLFKKLKFWKSDRYFIKVSVLSKSCFPK